jgi:hypothetical protein
MLQQPNVVKRPCARCGWSATGEFNEHDWMRERTIAGDQLNKPRIGATEMINPYRCVDEHAH